MEALQSARYIHAFYEWVIFSTTKVLVKNSEGISIIYSGKERQFTMHSSTKYMNFIPWSFVLSSATKSSAVK